MFTIDHFRQALDNRYAWPGGYPTYLLTADGAALCHQCCHDNRADIEHAIEHDHTRSGWRVNAHTVNWEDGDLQCEHCGERIESAYAEEEDC